MSDLPPPSTAPVFEGSPTGPESKGDGLSTILVTVLSVAAVLSAVVLVSTLFGDSDVDDPAAAPGPATSMPMAVDEADSQALDATTSSIAAASTTATTDSPVAAPPATKPVSTSVEASATTTSAPSTTPRLWLLIPLHRRLPKRHLHRRIRRHRSRAMRRPVPVTRFCLMGARSRSKRCTRAPS